MTFCPEWLTGSPNLDTSSAWSFWIYLVVRAASVPYLGFNLLNVSSPPVHEHYLGLGSTLAHVGLLPRNYCIAAFDSQSQVVLKMHR